MRASEQLNELAGALAKAQGLMGNATINKVNPHFKSKYADLAAIREAVTVPLASQGLAVIQAIDSDDKGAFLVTRMVHSSGQWIESVHPLPAMAKPQEFGSALTYARRYSLAAICAISAEEDDDANAANDAPVSTARAPAKPAAPNGRGGKTTASAWAGEAAEKIKKMKTVKELDAWAEANDATLNKLFDVDREAADALNDAIETKREALNVMAAG